MNFVANYTWTEEQDSTIRSRLLHYRSLAIGLKGFLLHTTIHPDVLRFNWGGLSRQFSPISPRVNIQVGTVPSDWVTPFVLQQVCLYNPYTTAEEYLQQFGNLPSDSYMGQMVRKYPKLRLHSDLARFMDFQDDVFPNMFPTVHYLKEIFNRRWFDMRCGVGYAAPHLLRTNFTTDRLLKEPETFVSLNPKSLGDHGPARTNILTKDMFLWYQKLVHHQSLLVYCRKGTIVIWMSSLDLYLKLMTLVYPIRVPEHPMDLFFHPDVTDRLLLDDQPTWDIMVLREGEFGCINSGSAYQIWAPVASIFTTNIIKLDTDTVERSSTAVTPQSPSSSSQEPQPGCSTTTSSSTPRSNKSTSKRVAETSNRTKHKKMSRSTECPVCFIKVIKSIQLKEHYAKKHPSYTTNNWPCSCKGTFSSTSALRRHHDKQIYPTCGQPIPESEDGRATHEVEPRVEVVYSTSSVICYTLADVSTETIHYYDNLIQGGEYPFTSGIKMDGYYDFIMSRIQNKIKRALKFKRKNECMIIHKTRNGMEQSYEQNIINRIKAPCALYFMSVV